MVTVRRRDTGGVGRGAFRRHARDGRRGLQDHAQSGPDRGRATLPQRGAIPQHHRPAGTPVHLSALRQRRRGHRHNPATDNLDNVYTLLRLVEDIRERYEIPAQSCLLAHVTITMALIRRGAPVDLVFQSIAGTEAANRSFGIDLGMLGEAREMALALGRGTLGENVMYFETGQGSALSADAHHGVDAQTCEARAYVVARAFSPLLINTVVGFIGPEYLYDGKQIIRAGLEDLFCGKLLGLPMGCDVCYTNHAEHVVSRCALPAGGAGPASGARILGVAEPHGDLRWQKRPRRAAPGDSAR
jgi:ethanolamine ammonia lyase large subunit EutB